MVEMTKVTVLETEKYDGKFSFGSDFEEGSFQRVLAELNGIMEQIPEEFRSSAMCSFDSSSGWEGSHYASIEISYKRPSTSREIAERAALAKGRALKELHLAQERLSAAERRMQTVGPA